jgi:hypothetical protein
MDIVKVVGAVLVLKIQLQRRHSAAGGKGALEVAWAGPAPSSVVCVVVGPLYRASHAHSVGEGAGAQACRAPTAEAPPRGFRPGGCLKSRFSTRARGCRSR